MVNVSGYPTTAATRERLEAATLGGPACVYDVDIMDMEGEDVLSYFPSIAEFIESHRIRGGGVLCHCFHGVSRSTTAAMVYVLKERRAEDAHVVLTDLRSKRACADPNLGFQAQLQVWCDLRFDLDADTPQHTIMRAIQAQMRFRRGCFGHEGGSTGACSCGKSWRCHKCGQVLFSESNILPASCTSEPPTEVDYSYAYSKKNKGVKKQGRQYSTPPPAGDETIWLEPLAWMIGVDAETGQPAGKINCPQCRNKLGSYTWLPDNGSKSLWPGLGLGRGAVVPAFCVSRKKLK